MRQSASGSDDFLCTTNWSVITGAPCSGKTTVIRRLEAAGFEVVHEAARAFIQAALKSGQSLNDVKSDIGRFEHNILQRKIDIEGALAKTAIVFFDRGIPDSIAYFKLAGLDASEPVQKSRIARYRHVFLLERLAYTHDPVRSEDDAKAQILHEYIEESYRMLGYDPIPIPLCPPADRTKLILRHLHQ